MPDSSPAGPTAKPATSTGQTILLVTGMSGAGKSTTLRVLEDLGWEVVDNIPLRLMRALLQSPLPTASDSVVRPLAVGVDARTRGFSADAVVRAIKRLRDDGGHFVSTLFLDCSGSELERRFSETRRRHPLAEDRPAADGIAREREMLDPLRRWAEQLVDTTALNSADLQAEIRQRYAREQDGGMAINILSFGFSRGIPRNADIILDVRFLQNPYWDTDLRKLTGLDEPVITHVSQDPAYELAISQYEQMLISLLPHYRDTGRAYLTVAFGCTGGRHRSVHVAERIAATLRRAGYEPGVTHRNLSALSHETLEGAAPKP